MNLTRFEDGRPYIVSGRVLNAMQDEIRRGYPKPSTSDFEVREGPTGVEFGLSVRATRRQLQISGDPATTASVYFGEATGLGFSGTITGMTEGAWTDYSATSGLDFYLKIQFEPDAETRVVSDGSGGSTTVYAVASGGSDGEVTIHTVTAGSSAPANTAPAVNASTGAATQDGIYYLKFGSITAANGPLNSFYGPVGISFCAPDSLKVWQISAVTD